MAAAVLCLSACKSVTTERPVLTIAGIKSSFHGDHPGKVTFQGVVTVENPNFGLIVVQDQTAGIRVEPAHFIGDSIKGHKVEVTGSLPSGSGTDSISGATVRDLGLGTLPEPVPITARDLTSDTLDGKLVSLFGTARLGTVDASGQLVLPLRLGGFEVTARFTDDRGLDADQLVDTEVRITGVASTGVDIHGNLTDLTILAADGKSITQLRAPPDPASLPVQDLKSVTSRSGSGQDHRVRLHGLIEHVGDAEGFRFTDSSASVAISDLEGFDVQPSQQIDIVAFVDHSDKGWTLGNVGTAVKANAVAEQEGSALIRTVAALHALKPELAGLQQSVSLDCVLTYYDPTWQMAFVQDRTGGVYVSLHGSANGSGEPRTLRAGDHVRLRGLSGAGDFAPVVQSPSFEFIEHSALPSPSTTLAEMIFSGQADSQWVELEGIVQGFGFEGNHPSAKLSYGSHNYKVIFPASVKLTPDWIDAHVKVRGAAGTVFNGKRQVLGIQLFAQDLSQLTPLPDSITADAGRKEQVTPINQLLRFRPNETPGHRVHLRGKVLATNPEGPSWIKDDSGAVAIREHSEIALQEGDVVDAVGFAVAGAFAVEIHEGVLSKRSSGVPVTPIDVTPERALFTGVDGQLIRVEGRLISEYQNGQEQILLLRNGKATFAVHGMGNLPGYEIGEVLRFSGICSVSAKRFRGVLVPNSFEVAVNSPSKVEVLEKAPWLTQQRAWRALSLTSVLVALALGWVFMLRRRVGAQTRLIEQKLIEVEKLKARAEAASEAKSQFLANMSHEIRTPMNGILGMTELAMQAASVDEQRECLSTIRSSGDALLSILNDLLDLSKIEAGQFEIQDSPFSLRDLVMESGKVFAFRMKEKGLQFESTVVDSLPDVLIGDAWRLRQILLNLLGNAVKFTEYGTIAMSADTRQEGDQTFLRLAVRDSGIGIPAEKQGQIFEAFRQADLSIARKYGGTGLGLSICLKLVSLMGGKIELESEAGKGSTFSVLLPLKVSDVQTSHTSVVVASAQAGLRSLNILLAEDNPVNQKVAARLLEKQGHRVTVAANGNLAVEQFKGRPFDLVLMDVQMPEMDGLEATREIRQFEATGKTRTPIIAMTAQTMKGDRDNCFAAGMDGFVSKPIRLPELWAAIDAARTTQ